ncbi:MAG TPA: hypothetical protein VMV09_03610 [Candidatus Saccharimonadales bacterium]|nr:hypothetical protein [Candidatus Saccharimonadales bacterium]
MNDHASTSGILDSKDLQRTAALVVAEDQHPIRLGRIIRWRLNEGKSTMADDEINLFIADPVPAGRRHDSDGQFRTP